MQNDRQNLTNRRLFFFIMCFIIVSCVDTYANCSKKLEIIIHDLNGICGIVNKLFRINLVFSLYSDLTAIYSEFQEIPGSRHLRLL